MKKEGCSIQPSQNECFYLCLLLVNIRGFVYVFFRYIGIFFLFLRQLKTDFENYFAIVQTL